MKKFMDKCVNKWKYERKIKAWKNYEVWINEGMNEWKYEQLNNEQRLKHERMIMFEWMNQWVNEGMNKWKYERTIKT